MSTEEIYEKLQSVFDSLFLSEVKVSPDLAAKDVEEWDPLKQLSLILVIEEQFDMRFRTGEVESARNIGELADLIQARTAGEPATQRSLYR